MGKKRIKPKKFLKRMQKKLVVLFLLISIVMIILIGRLMYIQYTSGSKYEKIVLSQQEYDSRNIPYQRGDILDTKGTVLATSIDVYNVILDVKVLTAQKERVEGTVDALVTCFPELNADTLNQLITDNPTSQYIILLKKLSYESIQSFVQMQENVDNKTISKDGVWFEKEYQRNYPYSTLASATIGFVSAGNVGTVGLENYYNSTLNGTNGREYGYLNADNNFEKTIKSAQDGSSIVSTIDVNIQSIVEEKVRLFNERYTNGYTSGDGSKNTSVLVMDPNSGSVLAMSSYPNFDLNNPRDLSAFYTQEEQDAMDSETKMDTLNNLWQNYVVNHTFEPGSTVKPITVAMGLETGALSGNETYLCDGSETFGTSVVHCVNRSGHGIQTIEQAMMNSCNDALMQMSYAIGIDQFVKYQSVFGFGKKTNIDLPGEADTSGLIYTKENMTAVDLATNSFGQNFNVSMIQMGAAVSSLINGGNYYQPHVVKSILDAQGNTIEKIDPIIQKKTISEETSELVKQYLYATLTDGTAKTAKVPGYSMGGKTGTAQKLPRADKKYLVSFVGYAPQENPQVLIYVIVDEPNVESQAHSTYAQNIARDILEEILPYMNIYQDEEITTEQATLYAQLKAEEGIIVENNVLVQEGQEETFENNSGEGDANVLE